MANEHSKHGFISRLCRVAVSAGFVALSATAARAAEPTTYWEAETKVEASQQKAEQVRERGGAAYKSGQVRQADDEVQKNTARADKLGEGPDGEQAQQRDQDSSVLTEKESFACQPTKPVAMNDCPKAETEAEDAAAD